MKILHVCLSSHYTEGMTYQDNLLPDQNAKDGHDVVVVSDCYKYCGPTLIKVEEEDQVLSSGVRLIRLRYDKIVNDFFSSKIRKTSSLAKLLEQIAPDVVLYHGVAGWELNTVAQYKKEYPHTKLYVDSHQDYNNSGLSWFSLFFQYKLFNRYIVKKTGKYVDKFLYVSYESGRFIREVYGLSDCNLEFYPLGGQIVDENVKNDFSKLIREKHGFDREDILVLHTGKLSKGKRTKELVGSLRLVRSRRIKLLIVGAIPEAEKEELEPLLSSDSRIYYLGWKSSEELIKYLCAADIYFQPGTQSATLQSAICAGTPVAVYPYESHKPYIKGNGFFVSDISDFVKAFEVILESPSILRGMSSKSYQVAREILDYRVLAARLYR